MTRCHRKGAGHECWWQRAGFVHARVGITKDRIMKPQDYWYTPCLLGAHYAAGCALLFSCPIVRPSALL